MRNRFLLGSVVFLGMSGSLYAQSAPVQLNAAQAFSENKGQWDEQARFLARSPGLNLWITGAGLVMDYHKFVASAGQKRDPRNPHWRPKGTMYGDVLRVSLVNARPTNVAGQGEISGDENYFIGNDPSHWASSVHRYSEARAEQPYPGISVRYYFDQGTPRYDILADPGADLSQVGFKVEGAQSMRILENGDLELLTPYGSIEEKGLRAYQKTNGATTQIPCRMAIDSGIIRFDLGSYDSSRPIVLDPLVFSTYLGGSATDLIIGVKVDSAKNVVVAGSTQSADFPTSTGAYQQTYPSKHSLQSVFISKLNTAGSLLLASTYLGGSGLDIGGDNVNGLALDASNNPVVVGYTDSTDFPVTTGALEGTNPVPGESNTGFVSKISSDGTKLLASSYLGGTASVSGDSANGVAVDSAGYTVVVGTTQNGAFPVSSTAFQKTYSGNSACFVAKLSADEKTLVSGTILSGSGGDLGSAVAIDASHNIVVVGSAFSSDFPVTSGAFQATNNGVGNSESNAFVAKFSPDCSTLVSCTLLGGHANNSGGGDVPNAVAIDDSGNTLVVGLTHSYEFPTTSGAFQSLDPEYFNLQSAGFVSKLSGDATKLLSSTFIGGTNGAFGNIIAGVALDASGNPVVAGYTDASDFPVTLGAFQTTNKTDGNLTGFVAKVTSDCTQLLASTYLGGSNNESIFALALDASSNPVVAGSTNSTDFPILIGSYELSALGGGDGFVTDLSFPAMTINVSPNAVAGGASAIGTVLLPNSAGLSGVTVSLNSGDSVVTVPTSIKVPSGSSVATFTITTVPVTAALGVTVQATLGSLIQQTTLTVNPPLVESVAFSPTSIAGGNPVNCTVTLGSPAAVGTTLAITTTGPITASASVPVVAGKSSATFSVATSGVNANTAATISAKLAGVTKAATLSITPATFSTFTETYTSLVGGSNQGATVAVNGLSGPAGDVVTFTVSGPVWPVATRSFVNRSSLPVTIPTQPVSVATAASVTAKIGAISKTISFTVTPSPIASVIVPTITLGGSSVTCVVNLSYPAGTGGDVITLAGTGTWTVPTSETVPAGKTSVSFTIPTKPVSASTISTVTATLGTSSVKATTMIAEASLSYMVILPPAAIGGTSAFGIISLSGPAGPSGDIVTLSGTGPLTLPISVTVPAGQTGAYFVISTKTVSVATAAKVTATVGTSLVSASLTVEP